MMLDGRQYVPAWNFMENYAGSENPFKITLAN